MSEAVSTCSAAGTMLPLRVSSRTAVYDVFINTSPHRQRAAEVEEEAGNLAGKNAPILGQGGRGGRG